MYKDTDFQYIEIPIQYYPVNNESPKIIHKILFSSRCNAKFVLDINRYIRDVLFVFK